MISYDRPGYGGSTPCPGRTVASAAEDVTAIANELNLKRLLIWGFSGGGPYALACAALLPDLVVAVAALASFAPYSATGLDWLAGMGEGNVAVFGAALKGREAVQQRVEAASPGMINADSANLIEVFRPFLCPADVAVFTEDFADYLLNGIREGIKERRDGWIEDYLMFITSWGFKLSQIRIPVLLLHGKQDRFVPFSHGEWLAGKIPNVDARLLADDGHLTLITHRIPEVHAWLLDKMQ